MPLATVSHVASGDSSSIHIDLPEEWEIRPEDLKLGPRVGIGSYGEVYRGVWRYTDVAVKRLIDQDLSSHLMEVLASLAFLLQLTAKAFTLCMQAADTRGLESFVEKLVHFCKLELADVAGVQSRNWNYEALAACQCSLVPGCCDATAQPCNCDAVHAPRITVQATS